MTNFLDRLAARTLGTAPLAQPIVPAVFAPADTGAQLDPAPSPWPLAETSAAPQQPTGQHDQPRNSDVQPQSLAKFATSDTSDAGSYAHFTRKPQSLAKLAATDIPQTMNERNVAVQSAPSQFPARSEAVPFAELHPAPVSFREQPLAVDDSPRAATQTRTITALAQHRPASAMEGPATPPGRRNAVANSAAQQPVIKVTIGRVDVRAEFPVAPPQPAMNRRQSSGMSLEEYARQRNEGKR